jgi:ppGpp synthetase/RelA/SpoT-type nucleotidyltranferase
MDDAIAALNAWASDITKSVKTGRPSGAGWMPTPGSKTGTWRRKTATGWEYTDGAPLQPDHAANKAFEEEKRVNALEYLEHASGTGGLTPGGARAHITLFHQLSARHNATFAPFMDKLKSIAPPGAEVKGRLKGYVSAMAKLADRHKDNKALRDPRALQDITGTTIVVETMAEAKAAIAAVLANFTTASWKDDYMTHPRADGYRAFHAYTQDGEGLRREVQVRTRNQDTWAAWAHELYKPQTKEQADALSHPQFRMAATLYGKALSSALADRDAGKHTPLPDPFPGLLELFPHWIED